MAGKGEISPDAVRAARQTLGLSKDELAAELGLTPAVIHAWEEGRVRATGRPARMLEWRAAVQAQENALAASGLSICPTAQALLTKLDAAGADINRSATALEQHAADCPSCQAREEFARTLPPVPEFPAGIGLGILLGISTRVARLPAWMRPAAWGALIVGLMVLVRMLFSMLADGPSWNLLLIAAAAFFIGGYLGAVGGLVYYLVRPRTRSWGRLGDYATGVACAWGYTVAFLGPAAVFSRDPSFRQPGMWVFIAGFGVLAGSLFGHFAFRERGD